MWGISYGGTNRHNVAPKVAPPVPSLVLSESEDERVQARLSDNFSLTYACGAGYKMLCVIERLSSGYVLTKGTTFKWDSCAPHAILRAMRGGVVKLDKVCATLLLNSRPNIRVCFWKNIKCDYGTLNYIKLPL